MQQFKNNVSQYTTEKRTSSSVVHNIIKPFRESVEISVSKGQGQKPISDVVVYKPSGSTALKQEQFCCGNHGMGS